MSQMMPISLYVCLIAHRHRQVAFSRSSCGYLILKATQKSDDRLRRFLSKSRQIKLYSGRRSTK